MDYKELFEKYRFLNENARLTEENNSLKARLGIIKPAPSEAGITKPIVQKIFSDKQSYGSAQESIMRIESPNIANELINNMNKGA